MLHRNQRLGDSALPIRRLVGLPARHTSCMAYTRLTTRLTAFPLFMFREKVFDEGLPLATDPLLHVCRYHDCF
jgi:hypothetical protein